MTLKQTDQQCRIELWTNTPDMAKLRRAANGTRHHRSVSEENGDTQSQDPDYDKAGLNMEDKWNRTLGLERPDEGSPHVSPRLPNWCVRPKPFTQPLGMPKTKRQSGGDTPEWKDATKLHSNSRVDREHNRHDVDRFPNRNRLLTNEKPELSRQQRKTLPRNFQSDGDSATPFPSPSTFRPSAGTNAELRADNSLGSNTNNEEESSMNHFRLGLFGGMQPDPKSQFGMLPLGANNLAAAAAAAMSPLFHNSVKDWASHSADEPNQAPSIPSGGPFSAVSAAASGLPNTSASSSLSSKSMDTCFPPMLAAAAVAALTGGRFPANGSGFPPFNPMFSASSNPLMYQAGSLGDVQSAMGFDRGPMSAASLMNNNASMSSADMAKELLFSPIRAMYHTSKSLFDPAGMSALSSCNRTGTTPPPPPLSASTSPQPMHMSRCPRGTMPSNSGNYCNSMDDGGDEGDENESVDGVDQALEMDESVSNANGHQWTFEEQFKQVCESLTHEVCPLCILKEQ